MVMRSNVFLLNNSPISKYMYLGYMDDKVHRKQMKKIIYYLLLKQSNTLLSYYAQRHKILIQSEVSYIIL